MIVEENEEGVLRLGGLFDKEQSLNILQFVDVLFIFDQQLEDQLFGLLTTLVLFYPPIVLYNLADKQTRILIALIVTPIVCGKSLRGHRVSHIVSELSLNLFCYFRSSEFGALIPHQTVLDDLPHELAHALEIALHVRVVASVEIAHLSVQLCTVAALVVDALAIVDADVDHPQGVDVNRFVVGPLPNLGIHIGERPNSRLHDLVFLFYLRAATEIADFSYSSSAHEDVVGFEVTMYYVLLVSVGESLGDLLADLHLPELIQFVFNVVLEVAFWAVLSDEIDQSFVDEVALIIFDDVGLVQLFKVGDLSDGLFEVACGLLFELLDRDVLPLGSLCPHYDPVAARADQFFFLVFLVELLLSDDRKQLPVFADEILKADHCTFYKKEILQRVNQSKGLSYQITSRHQRTESQIKWRKKYYYMSGWGRADSQVVQALT